MRFIAASAGCSKFGNSKVVFALIVIEKTALNSSPGKKGATFSLPESESET